MSKTINTISQQMPAEVKLTAVTNNIAKIDCLFDVYSKKKKHITRHIKLALISDVHWDNPKCDRTLLKQHLDFCKDNNIKVAINGDLFCLMQGKGDPRGSKDDVRPEHNNARYLDSIVNTAIDWFGPYKDILTVIGYGNHETKIIKFKETDLLKRFVDFFNAKHGSNVILGGYGGRIIINANLATGGQTKRNRMYKIKYFHGSGGGGIVTRGEINFTRALETYEDMDMFWMGHVHENKETTVVREALNKNCDKIIHREIKLVNSGTYKEEYGDGSKGWHIERGAPPKPIGGRILDIRVTIHDSGNVILNPRTYNFQ